MLSVLVLLIAFSGAVSANPPVTTPQPPATTTSTTTTSATTVPPTTAPHCEPPGCIEESVYVPEDEQGACCYGGTSLGNHFSAATCHYAFAGPGTTERDCVHPHKCCTATECEHANCFDCWQKKGRIVESCDECDCDVPTTTTTGMTKSTTGVTLPPAPAPTPKVPPSGCCCNASNPTVMTAEACYACDGEYQGDGTTCEGAEQGACRKRCCEGVGSQCITCPPNYASNSTLEFIGFGAEECALDACGVACCIGGVPLPANSAEECFHHAGEPQLGVSVEEAQCGFSCCSGLQFSVEESEEACLQLRLGRPLGPNIGNSPGVCGGACCGISARKRQADHVGDAEDCEVLSREDCQELSGIYQGDDVPCGSVVPAERPEDDDDTPSSQIRFDVCTNDGVCCPRNESASPFLAPSGAQCNGVFLGAGSYLEPGQCERGVCCHEGPGGQRMVNNEAECCLYPNGQYQGNGTRLGQPGMCDEGSGACHCGDQCFNVPSAAICKDNHPDNVFGGVGSKCNDPPTPPGDNKGSCCLRTSVHSSDKICKVRSEAKCLWLGGVFGGEGSECGEATCEIARGSCCSRKPDAHPSDRSPSAYTCQDHQTHEQCLACGGSWGGDSSLCSDEYSCPNRHKGPCCRAGFECAMMTSTACKREEGFFKGFNATCESEGICRDCSACKMQGPPCNDMLPCTAPNAVCMRQFGYCAIMTTRLPTEIDHTLPPVSEEAPLQPTTDETTTTATTTTTAAPATTTAAPSTHDYVGPLSCGDNSTIGMPCIGDRVNGKCRIGVCVAPPVDSGIDASCGAICRNIREYPCGCECENAWRSSCASLTGRVILEGEGDAGVPHATVELLRRDTHGGYTFVSQKTTDESGRYAFTSIRAGKYKVRVHVTDCYVLSDESNHRIVELTCLENEEVPLSLRSAPLSLTAQLEHRENGVRIAEHINFYAHEDCDAAAIVDEHNDDDDTSDVGNAPGDDDDDSRGRGRGGRRRRHGISPTATLLLIVGAVIVGGGLYMVAMGRSKKNKSRKSKK